MARKPKSDDDTAATAEGGTRAGSDSGGESIHGWFTAFFTNNPKYLKIRSNEAAIQAWMDAHPGEQEVPDKVKNAVSNVKSHLRHKKKKRKTRAAVAEPANGTRHSGPKPPQKVLQSLEEQIDGCLAMAKTLDPAGLDEVIQSLRKARNQVIVKQGTP